ncbi:MAG: hypothetical protein JRJ49_03320 [Deltaproteobacteria bacterium]|nr:hypothetical protein [Deltaproteobacteria bacterium]
MKKKRNKSISFDAMVKFFMQSYDIPAGKDIKKISLQLDRIEALIASLCAGEKNVVKTPLSNIKISLTTRVLNFIKRFKNGVSVLQIKAETGLEDKRLRNIIYRLHNSDQIKRKKRGVYISFIKE